MCEAKAYLLINGQEREVMEAVDEVVETDGTVAIRSIFGEEKLFKARVKAFSLVNHKVILEPIE